MAKDATMSLTRQGHGGVYHGILENQDHIHDMMMTDNLEEDRAMQLEECKKRQKLAKNQNQQLGQSFVGCTSSILISTQDTDEAVGLGH